MVQDAIPDSGEPTTTPHHGQVVESVLEIATTTSAQRLALLLGETTFYSVSSLDEAALVQATLDLKAQKDDMAARANYGERAFKLIVKWLFVVLLTVWLCAIKITFPHDRWRPSEIEFDLPDSVLLMLLGTTTANLFGLLMLVFGYLFPPGGSKRK